MKDELKQLGSHEDMEQKHNLSELLSQSQMTSCELRLGKALDLLGMGALLKLDSYKQSENQSLAS